MPPKSRTAKTTTRTTPQARVRASTPAEIATYPGPEAFEEEDGPLVDLDAMAANSADGDVHLFTLQGVDYFIPAEPPANYTLKYLRMIRTHGQEAAGAALMEWMLGTEAYEALMNYDGLTTGMLQSVMAAVQKHVAGAAERAGITAPLG